jgi:serine/threonine protein phosphatase PrpC
MGDRPSMEDSVVFKNYQNGSFLCGVFDGHTGKVASATAGWCLSQELRKWLGSDSISGALQVAFNSVNEKLRLLNVWDGCTAAAALLHKGKCYLASIGDSRIVRVKRDGTVERMTVDAKPTNRVEYERLRSRGLTINSDGRISRKLAVARTLGDFWCSEKGLYVEPDVREFEIEDEEDSLIVACDGLWDVMGDEQAGLVVLEAETAVDAAVSLKNFALGLGSKGNITVIVVKFHPNSGDGGLCGRNTVKKLPFIEDGDEEEMEVEIEQRRRYF